MLLKTKRALLVNPPLWNAYAPHLAVPLLTACMRERGHRVSAYDLGIESVNWLLGADGLRAMAPRIQRDWAGDEEQRRTQERARLVLEPTIELIEEAKRVLRDEHALHDEARHAQARLVVRNAMWCVSAAFPGHEFDLVANDLYYSARSSQQVLDAVVDRERNVYRWAFEHCMPPDLLDDPDLDLVGVSVSADTQLIAALTFVKILREQRPDIRVVLGGNYTTRMIDRWTERHPFFDMVDYFVHSEGEDALPMLFEADGPEALAKVPGLVWMDGDRLRKNPPRKVRIEQLPAPDYDDYPLDKYFAPGPILPVFASRSCAWECAFCAIPFASGKYRGRSANTTVDQIEWLAQRHGTRYFMFVDEILTLRSLGTVADELIKRETDINWYGETRFARGLDEDLAERLYASGCRRMNFGLESHVQRVLDLMKKDTEVGAIDTTVEAMLKAGVPVHLFVIHGFPGETEEEARHTVEFAETTIRRATDEFGVKHCTWGGSPFVLDAFSPVASDPEKFGVRVILPPESDDLALTYDYEVERGMDARESVLFGRDVQRPLEVSAQQWFRPGRAAALTGVEEYTFVRASNGAEAAQLLPNGGRDEIPLLPGEPLTLAPHTEIRRLPWTGAEGEAGELVRWGLYAAIGDRFVELHTPATVDLELLRTTTPAEELAALFERDGVVGVTVTGAELVALLVRFGFLAGEATHSVHPAAWPDALASAGTAVSENPVFVREPGVHEVEEDTTIVLSSTVTGHALRLGRLGRLLWLACEEGLGLAGGHDPHGVWDLGLVAETERILAKLEMYGFVHRRAHAADLEPAR
ncbi:B12-binding domain-containing radical SAM protein [Streptomyces sp. NPDC004327]|uniref:B12-binding domain-containing radical SAM protein n=1 Tax=unclassified Streptomyces TaxID=2593676 RepID=UPI0036D0FFC3